MLKKIGVLWKNRRRFFGFKALIVSIFIMILPQVSHGQRFLSDYDSTIFMRDTLRAFLRRMENLHFSGYIQPQFQAAAAQGADSYSGGNFSEYSDNRFMLRRARLKLDYILVHNDHKLPAALLSFQVDATERGVNVRDMFARVYEPTRQRFFMTMGLFARPFGYEVNLSSSFRETPERGRMSQILMPSERDMGVMLSYDWQRGTERKSVLRWDAGLFNGQGLSGTSDFDSFKDIISRITLKPQFLSRRFSAGGGVSLLSGGWRQATRYRYEMGNFNNAAGFVVDSSLENIGGKVPRQYYGADLQLVQRHEWGKTELRAEYWKGKQPGSFSSTTNPGTLPMEPTYIRPFNGAFFCFLQNILNENWELVIKYDWYDPNTKTGGDGIGKAGSNFSPADIRFQTLGFGLTRYFNKNLKALLYYDRVTNEGTLLNGYVSDLEDNVFTARLQMLF